MKIKLEKLMAGPGGVFHPGTVLSLDDDVALALLRIGAATPVPGVFERAIQAVGEIRRRRGRPRGSKSGDSTNDRGDDNADREVLAAGGLGR